MPLVDLATAKRELRVTHDAEDLDITRKVAAAEEQAVLFLGRNVYATQDDLTAAIAAVPATLTAASTAYESAITAAGQVVAVAERDAQIALAKDTYYDAIASWQRVQRGIVVNDSIRTAILLITASLWEHRGDEDAIEGIPQAARSFLWPFRIALGV